MKPTYVKHLLIVMIVAVLALTACATALTGDDEESSMRLLRIEGSVQIENEDGKTEDAKEGTGFKSGDALITGEDSLASVSLDDTKHVVLDEKSRVEFYREGDDLKLKLTQGSLFLDVSEKLAENETLEIETSTMTAGIRGTIVFLTDRQDPTNPQNRINTLGVLEGTAEATYTNSNGAKKMLPVPAGQRVVLQEADEGNLSPEAVAMSAADVPAFVAQQVLGDQVLKNRVENATDLELDSFAAAGDWMWDSTVTLVAQSASKLYDGQPLTRPSDVLVYGLPVSFNIRVQAGGSQTDAGESENPIGPYTIYNAMDQDVTRHFSSIEKVSGRLVVDPAPLTVWTGSAEKEYDGVPLTNPEAKLTFYPGYDPEQTLWRNISCVLPYDLGSEVLYGLAGVTHVHGTNPLTGETREIMLYAGEKLTVFLSDKDGAQSIDLLVEPVTEKEIPKDLLRLYADNPELLEQACEDTGWDQDIIAGRIAELAENDEATVKRYGLTVRESIAEGLMSEFSNVRIQINTEITNYNGRALGGEEAHFTGMRLDGSILVKATGSQTEVGQSENTYEIDWGGANPVNYILSEELGTLTVTEKQSQPRFIFSPVTLTAGSASKQYDGKPLTVGTYTVSGLPEGYTCSAEVSGTQTNVGESENVIQSWQILNTDGTDVTEYFKNVNLAAGSLKVSPATLTIRTGSDSKRYDATPLTCDEVEVSGLVNGERVEVKATGTITDVGTAINTYEIVWGTTNQNNYEITEDLGTLTVTPPSKPEPAPQPIIGTVTLTAGSATKCYDGKPLTTTIYNVSGLPEGYTCSAEVSGTRTDAGYSYTEIKNYHISDVKNNEVTELFNVKLVKGELFIDPAVLIIRTGSSEKVYDGEPLTCDETEVKGLVNGERVEVKATGTITDVGKATNTYEIDWGETNPGNYAISDDFGTLKVSELKLDCDLGGKKVVYNGQDFIPEVKITYMNGPHAGETVSGTRINVKNDVKTDVKTDTTGWEFVLFTGDTINLEVAGEVKDVGTYTVKGSYTCNDENDENDDKKDKKDNIKLSYSNDKYTVETAPLTIKTKTAEKAYDGTPLTEPEVEISGLADGERVEVKATGTITDVGTAFNTYEIDWGETNPNNYEIKETIGTLTITHNDAAVTFTADSTEKYYDGKPLTSSRVTVSGLPEGLSFTASAQGSQTQAGTGSNVVTSYSIQDAKGKDVTAFFTGINVVNGTLKIVPAPLTISTGSADKVYDGTALTNTEANVSGLINGETITVKATGSITNAGAMENTCEITWGKTNPNNYELTKALGTLTVTPLPVNFNLYCYEMTYCAQKVVPESVTGTYADGTEVACEDLHYLTDDKGYPLSTVGVFNLIGGGVVKLTCEGVTDAGEYVITPIVEFTKGNKDNYIFNYSGNKMIITPVDVKFDLDGIGSVSYDGGFHGGDLMVDSYESFFSEKISDTQWRVTWDWGDVIDVTITGGGTEPGEYQLRCSYSFNFGNPGNYAITVVDQTLTILGAEGVVPGGFAAFAMLAAPSETVTPAASPAEEEYDGNRNEPKETGAVNDIPVIKTYDSTTDRPQQLFSRQPKMTIFVPVEDQEPVREETPAAEIVPVEEKAPVEEEAQPAEEQTSAEEEALIEKEETQIEDEDPEEEAVPVEEETLTEAEEAPEEEAVLPEEKQVMSAEETIPAKEEAMSEEEEIPAEDAVPAEEKIPSEEEVPVGE